MTQDQFNIRYSFDKSNDRLGSGAFGTVYKVYDNVLNLYKAVKIAKVQNINSKEFSLLSEYKNVKNIPPHTNIANYEAVYQFETNYELLDFAIMQYYEDGTLKDLLKRHSLSDTQKLSIINGLLSGVSHLHKAGVIHRDLKAGNILIARDQKGEFIPKISDFGLSKLIEYNNDESLSNSFQGGSIDYSSPEQLMGLKLLPNTDIWSLGVMIFEIFTGKKPFQGDDNSVTPEIKRHTTLVKIFNGQISELLNQCPFPYSDLLPLCLRTDPYQRIKSVEQIIKFIEHPELINSAEINNAWDDEETIVFKYEDKDKNNYPIIFNKFLESLGIKPNPVPKIDTPDDAFIINKRKEVINKNNEEFQKLKNLSQQYIIEGDQLLLEGYFEEAILKFQTSLNFYISEDVRLKITELQIQIQKAEKLIDEANDFIDQAHLEKAKDLVFKSLEIYPQFQKAITLKTKIEELMVLQKKIDEFNGLVKDTASNDSEIKQQTTIELYKKAQDTAHSLDFLTAISLYEKILEIQPNDKNIKSALDVVKDKIEKQKIIDKFNAFIERAEEKKAEGDFGSSLNYLAEAESLLPLTPSLKEFKKILLNLLQEHEVQSKIEDLIQEGKLFYEKKDLVKALDSFEQAFKLSKNKDIVAEEFINLLKTELQQSKIEEEIQSTIQKAESQYLVGNIKDTIETYHKLNKKYPDQPGISSRLAELNEEQAKQILKEKKTQSNSRFNSLIDLTNQALNKKNYKLAHNNIIDAIKLQPANTDALKLKIEIEKLLQDEKDRMVPWYTILSNFGTANRSYLLLGLGLLAILAASYRFLTQPKNSQQSNQMEIFREEGYFGCKLNGIEIVSPTFDTLYKDGLQILKGVRNDSSFVINVDGSISHTKPVLPPILTKEWIEGITDIEELYILKNQFPNHNLTPLIDKRIKNLLTLEEEKLYGEIINISALDIENIKSKIQQYLLDYPKGKYKVELKNRLEEIINKEVADMSEEKLFEEALKQNTIEYWDAFITKFSSGSRNLQAQKNKAKLIRDTDDTAWSEAKKHAEENNSTEKIDKYLNQYTIHTGEAKALKAKIELNLKVAREKEHAAAWNAIKEGENINEIKKFISDYATSIFRDDAKKLIEEIENRLPIPPIVLEIDSKMADFGGGSFTLGCDTGGNCDDDALPPVRVNIKNVAISKYEVTQAEYEAIMGVNPAFFKDCTSCPVENVSFNDAMEYIRKLNALIGNPYKFRLPTEAEWEYFALANKNTLYAGSNNIDDVAQYGTKTGGTINVKSKKSNDFGIYGMTGNVAEWCADYYHEDAYAKYSGKAATDPTPTRVVRGGSFKDPARFCKVKSRKSVAADEKADWLGFRLVQENKLR